jgi:hypothetical protein
MGIFQTMEDQIILMIAGVFVMAILVLGKRY